MKRSLKLTGIGTAIAAAAIAGGFGVALAQDNDDGHNDGQRMTGGMAMQMDMDPAAMQQHMQEILGDETYNELQGAMKSVLGDQGYQQMLERMATGCAGAMGMTAPGSGAPAAPGHSGHHAATPQTTN